MLIAHVPLLLKIFLLAGLVFALFTFKQGVFEFLDFLLKSELRPPPDSYHWPALDLSLLEGAPTFLSQSHMHVISVPCTFFSHVISVLCTFVSLVMSVPHTFLYSQVEFQIEECTGQNLPTGMYREHYLPDKRNVQDRTLLICSRECTGQKAKFQFGNTQTEWHLDF